VGIWFIDTGNSERLHYHKENTAVNKEKNYKAKLKEMPSSGSCIPYKFLNSLSAP